MEQNSATNSTAKDPVCGMDVVPGGARSWDYQFEKILYHFCGPDCRSRFQHDPAAVLVAGPGAIEDVRASWKKGEQASWWKMWKERIQGWRV